MNSHLIEGVKQAIKDCENNKGFYNTSIYGESRYFKAKKIESLKKRLHYYEMGAEEIAI